MQLDFQRYECKYLIPAGLCPAIKDYIACYCAPDQYTAARPGEGYVITSLYLDTPYLTFHLAKTRKDLSRMKLRIRIYDEQAEGPAFFEIKRKIKGVIHKRRVLITRWDWATQMDGGEPLADDSATARDRAVASEFMALKDRFGAFPAALVRYSRQAYQGLIDDYSRVTFDSRLMCHPPLGYRFATGLRGWLSIDDPLAAERLHSAVVLELKFANHAPRWMIDLVRRFSLQLRGFSKYSTAIDRSLSIYRADSDLRAPRRRSA